jgi:hypothetical protein
MELMADTESKLQTEAQAVADALGEAVPGVIVWTS